MATKILIPSALKKHTNNQDSFQVLGGTVKELLQTLVQRFQGLKHCIFNEKGELKGNIVLYLNERKVEDFQDGNVPVKESDVLTIIPAIAGGRGSSVVEAGGTTFTREEVKRYSRHLIMPEVGIEGQAKLKQASVLLIGAGGLGAPTGLYLAAAGVGKIGLVDFDKVDFSNLQRQVIYTTQDVGKSKVESAKARLLALNPEITVQTHEAHLDSSNALDIIKEYDIIVNGTDNFPTRYLVNDACVLLKKTLVDGSIFRFEGNITVFDARKGPCYRCLFPSPPPPGMVPSCAEGGVLGILPGLIGLMEATETVKLILGAGTSLVGRLLTFNALDMKFREYKVRKSSACPICGDKPTITKLIDYEEFCGMRGVEAPQQVSADMAEWEITATELKVKMDHKENFKLIDVREPHEYQICKIPGSVLIPMNEVPLHLHELDTAQDIVLHCHSGMRSMKVLQFLRENGFKKLKNLQGGIDAWSTEVDPSVPQY